jgi:hypothetical protein
MWTPKGAPFFGAQSWVVLDFPEQQKLRCIDFKLRDGHPVFDWSIDEVKLYQEKR